MTTFKYFLILITLDIASICFVGAEELSEPDGKIGIFKQSNSGDCFFLASLLALANDPDGKSLVESAISKTSRPGKWKVLFPNRNNLPMVVNQKELDEYKLSSISGLPNGNLVTGDPDIQIFEIAADKIWRKQKINPKGLCDDISMNALAMFSETSQRLIWNRKRASLVAVQDIEKYKRLPKEAIQEEQVASYRDAHKVIESITKSDTDGVTMILLDYKRYHGVAIVDLDFETMKYSYIDSLRGTKNVLTADLKTLLERVVNGQYAINYMEISKEKKNEGQKPKEK